MKLVGFSADGKRNLGRVKAISAAIRGGNFNNSTNAGVFALNLNNSPGNSNYNIGFRACKRLSPKVQARGISPGLSAFLLGALILVALAAKYQKRGRGDNQVEFPRPASGRPMRGKHYGDLYPQIYSFENLHRAYLNARRNKRYRDEVLEFSLRLEENLITLQNELIWKTYRTSKYREFKVCEPKERLIMALPFRDRVVHHALCNVIEPIFEKIFIFDSYACRKTKGIHAASKRVTQFLRRARRKWGDSVYCFRLDVTKYFPSVNHRILSTILQKKIICPDTRWLMDEILFSVGDRDDPQSCGLPIGNLTSQLWANAYLNELDHFIKERLKIKLYLRYMDDFIILGPYKIELGKVKAEIVAFLWDNLLLTPNSKTTIFPARQGVDFVGYRTWPDYKLLRKSSVGRAKRRLKKLAVLVSANHISPTKLHSSLVSWAGYCSHADAQRIKNKIFRDIEARRRIHDVDGRRNRDKVADH